MSKKAPLIAILSMKTSESAGSIRLKARCLLRLSGSSEPMDTDRIRIDIPVRRNAFSISFAEKYGKRMIGGFRLNSVELTVSRDEASSFDIQNKLSVIYDDRYEGRIVYSLYDGKKGRNRNAEVHVRDGIAMYFRQSRYNSLTFTVRDENPYDSPEGQRRIKKAYRLAMANRKKRIGTGRAGLDRSSEPVLMYEKNCARYEESASVLYEKLIDSGYDNVFYVVNEDNPSIAGLPEKYRKNLVWKDSDRHLQLFFESDTFIATESTEHALQLRAASKLVMDKVHSRDLRYVFLQHGVMYMVSLNSGLRAGFRSAKMKLQRTVVSSELEAQHFIQLAGMSREELYITGLAKFDKCGRNAGADRIVIMPTWRRWETNQARDDLENTGYYRMVRRMFEAVPQSLRDKTVILPHPLMADRFRDHADLGANILLADSYDRVLRDCDLLITDYSSIAYDAFYRGANVIFCWDEKDECMEHYGEGTKLMLDMENVFGSVCMDSAGLAAAIEQNYGKEQSQENINRYRRIVEYHDGKNSERIIECLKKDKII